MQRKFRLTRSEDFKRVRRSGKSYAHPLVVLIVQTHDKRSTTPASVSGAKALPHALGGNPVDQPRVRVGVAAGRTVGTAVTRNHAKRLLREAMRPLLSNIASNLDLILIARQSILEASFPQIQAALNTLLRRAHLIQEVHDY